MEEIKENKYLFWNETGREGGVVNAVTWGWFGVTGEGFRHPLTMFIRISQPNWG